MKKTIMIMVVILVFVAGLYGAYWFGKQSGEKPQSQSGQSTVHSRTTTRGS